STLSCARARSCSRFQPALATPMTGTLRCPRLTIACSAGKIFLYARSPVAPKKTRASEWESCIAFSSWGGFFQMSTELVTHGREQFVGEICLTAQAEPLVQSSRQDMRWHGFVHAALDRRTGPARVRRSPCEVRQPQGEVGPEEIRDGGGRLDHHQPRRADTAAPPLLRNVWEIEFVLVVFGVAQWRRLSVNRVLVCAHVGGT